MLASSVAEARNLSPAPGPFASQVVFAAAWLAVRVTFLVSARRSKLGAT